MLWLDILLLVVAVALMAAILVQNRAAGVGGAFGGSAESLYTRRGSEKRLFQITVILGIAFIAVAAAHLFIP